MLKKELSSVFYPKIYGFDTGFMCFAKGWSNLRTGDFGPLWEHLVLNNLIGTFQTNVTISYWRDKRGHEIDFILKKDRNHEPIAVECTWNYKNFDFTSIRHFRNRYPEGRNFVVAANVFETNTRRFEGLDVTFLSLTELMKVLT